MGFLSGILDYASHAVQPALQVAAARQQGQMIAHQQQAQQLLQQYAIERQQRQDAMAQALAQSTMATRQSTAQHQQNQDAAAAQRAGAAVKREQFLENQPKAPTPGTAPYYDMKKQEALIGAQYGYHPPVQQPLVLTQDPSNPNGPGVYTPRNQAAGQRAPGKQAAANIAAPMAAKVGQFGEMLKKADDLMPAMDALDVSVGNSAANDIAQHGVGIGGMHIPGTQGIGNVMVNRTPEYSRYQAALAPFILAAAHALSGARINQDQVAQIKKAVEIQPGDTPQVRAQKKKNVVDLMNSIGGALPPDAVQQQEGQMGQDAIARLRGYGYESTQSGSSRQPNDQGGNINLGGQVAKPAKPAKAFDPDAVYQSYVKGKQP